MTDQDITQPDKTGRKKLNETALYAGTPGAAYVDEFLPSHGMEDDWLIETINAGALLVCPRCFFLHLPAFAMPHEKRPGDPDPVDACDVCAHAFAAAELGFDVSARVMLQARERLAEARAKRATLFYDLWMGASLAADTWVLAVLGDTLAGVKENVRKEVVRPAARKAER